MSKTTLTVRLSSYGTAPCNTRLKSREQLLGRPVKGNSWETLVIEHIAACLPLGWELAFWRTSGGSEIDLLLISGMEVKIAIEIKTGLTPKPRKGFYSGCKDLQPEEQWVIYPGERTIPLNKGEILAIPLTDAMARLCSRRT